LSDDEWADFLFMRDNPKGEFAERWMHAAGCRRWFNVKRHTVTHRIVAVYRIGEPAP
jgi:heterotetrameric sarcosine oxidase delta subunit